MDSKKDLKELKALISYLVGHNVSHVQELEELSKSMMGMDEAKKKVMDATKCYKKGNEELESALEKIEEE